MKLLIVSGSTPARWAKPRFGSAPSSGIKRPRYTVIARDRWRRWQSICRKPSPPPSAAVKCQNDGGARARLLAAAWQRLLSQDEARRIAANIAKLLSYCGKPKCDP